MQQRKLIVIGGGAAGFFCAVNAARFNPSLKVVIVEKSTKLLSKVKVSGGGRCNVTHACFDIETLITKYPRGKNFLKKAFHHFNTKDTIEWFEDRGVLMHTESDGRMFPVTNTSQTIIDCLLQEADKYKVEVIMNCDIKSFIKSASGFELQTSRDIILTADYLCIACGGYPKSIQFEWLTSKGHTIESPLPSLFTFNMPGNTITSLMGISVDSVIIKIQGTKLMQQGPLLITHWGLSGPAVLKLSAFAATDLAEKKYNFSVLINWIYPYTEASLRTAWPDLRKEYGAQKIMQRNPFGLPNRLWEYFLVQSGINDEVRWSSITSIQQNKLIQNLTAQVMQISGKTTFKEEFVTCGGIQLGEIDANSMGSKIISGLFFAGEIMNVDGITGGFNFQHAWTSGYIAAKKIATCSLE